MIFKFQGLFIYFFCTIKTFFFFLGCLQSNGKYLFGWQTWYFEVSFIRSGRVCFSWCGAHPRSCRLGPPLCRWLSYPTLSLGLRRWLALVGHDMVLQRMSPQILQGVTCTGLVAFPLQLLPKPTTRPLCGRIDLKTWTLIWPKIMAVNTSFLLSDCSRNEHVV